MSKSKIPSRSSANTGQGQLRGFGHARASRTRCPDAHGTSSHVHTRTSATHDTMTQVLGVNP